MSPELRGIGIPMDNVQPLLREKDIEKLVLSSGHRDFAHNVSWLLYRARKITELFIELRNEENPGSLVTLLTGLPNVSSLAIDGNKNTTCSGTEAMIRGQLSKVHGKRHPLKQLTIRNSHIHLLHLDLVRHVFTDLERLVLQNIRYFERVDESRTVIALPDSLRYLEIDRVFKSLKHDDRAKFYVRFVGVAPSPSGEDNIKATRWFYSYTEENGGSTDASTNEMSSEEEKNAIKNYTLPARGRTDANEY